MAAPPKPVPQKDERTERLAAALRENLKRRKAQARSQARAAANCSEGQGGKGQSVEPGESGGSGG